MLSWALPLCVTVLGYGLAAGLWKTAGPTAAAFCVLFALMKTPTNWVGWWLGGHPNPFAAPRFLRWAVFGQLLNGMAWICYFKAMSDGPVAIVQTITAAYTALAAILALVFLRERIVWVQGLGIALVIGAGLSLGYSGSTTGGQGPWVAESFLTLLFWASAVTVFKHAYNQEGSNDASFFLVNWAAMLLTVLPYGLLNHGAENLGEGLGMGLLIVGLYCVGDLTLFAAISRGPAAIVSPVSGLYPLPTVIYAALVLHEAITPQQWVAIVVVLVAIVLIVPENDNPILRLLRRQ